MLRLLLSLMLVGAIMGCGGVSVTPNPDPVAVTGNVTLAGKPATDIVVNFQPIEGGLPAVCTVKDGKFEAQITPGKYTYFVSKAATPTGEKTLSKFPAPLQQGAMDRTVEVTGPGPVELTMN